MPVGSGGTVGTCGVFWILSSTGKIPKSGNPPCELLLMAFRVHSSRPECREFGKRQIIPFSWVNPELCFSSPGPAVSVISVILATCHGSTGDLKLKLPTPLTAFLRLLVVVGATSAWAGCR